MLRALISSLLGHRPRLGPVLDEPVRLDQARALMRVREYEPAKLILRELIARQAQAARCWELLGAIALEQGDDEAAWQGFEAALEEDDPTPQMLANAAETARRTERFERAMSLCGQALALQPQYAPALHIRALALQSCWRMDEARDALEELVRRQPHFEKAQASWLFLLNHIGADAGVLRAEHLRWAAIHAEPLAEAHAFVNDRDPERRLKIGYLSGDFRDHAAAHFVEGVLASHDARAFEVFCYSSTEKLDATTGRLRSLAHQWRDIRWAEDAEAARIIREDRIDVLVDLSGHTRANRLRVLARRVAPVQATWLGYPATTGMSAMDYRITDPIADPPGSSERAYCEELLRMPSTLWCFRPPAGMPEPGPGTGRETLFGALNSMLKITAQMVSLWACVLRACPGSRLALVTVPQGEARSRIAAAFAANGVPAAALEFHGRLTREEFWDLHRRIDVALDTFPCNGGATTCETLWMGVPVVTRWSDLFQSRAGLSLLTSIGLPELAAANDGDYVRIATDLAGDAARRADLRRSLRSRMLGSPLMDAAGFTRALEALYRGAWKRWLTLPGA